MCGRPHIRMEGYRQREDANAKSYQKFRHRPHSNPLCDIDILLPCSRPEEFPFDKYYPVQRAPAGFDLVDIGCGYGDFIKKMAQLHRDKIFLGLEIRDRAVAIAQQQLLDARERSAACNNAAVIRCNALRQLPFVLAGGSVEVLTVMFPDPQFKSGNERRRVVNSLVAVEYAYYLRPGGYLLTCTDVESLAEYMAAQIEDSGCFARLDGTTVDDELVHNSLRCMDETADAIRH